MIFAIFCRYSDNIWYWMKLNLNFILNLFPESNSTLPNIATLILHNIFIEIYFWCFRLFWIFIYNTDFPWPWKDYFLLLAGRCQLCRLQFKYKYINMELISSSIGASVICVNKLFYYIIILCEAKLANSFIS